MMGSSIATGSPNASPAPHDGAVASTPLKVGVFGASGTTGVELTRLLVSHPLCAVAFATSREHAGKSLRAADPAAPDVALVDPDAVALEGLDVAFICLPHGHAAAMAERCVEAGVRTVDLSGDLRLRSEPLHARVYGTQRNAEIAGRAVYGLSEFERDALSEADVVSNPGCYPTCVALGLEPLARAGALGQTVVVNAVSGISGAGRKATAKTHFIAVADDVRPYNLGRSHRHTAEIEQTLAGFVPEGAPAPKVVFCPHVVPLERGMLATIVVELDALSAEEVHARYERAYASDRLVEVLPYGEPAQIRAVTRTPRAAIGIHEVAGLDHVVITCAIDNLLKGAAGQALHNMNLMFGLDETLGLEAGIPVPGATC